MSTTALGRDNRWEDGFTGPSLAAVALTRSDPETSTPTAPSVPHPLGTAGIVVACAAAILCAAIAANANRQGHDWAVPLFYGAMGLMVLPVAVRLVLPQADRAQRIAAVGLLTFSLFVVRIIRAPTYFVGHDEYLHLSSVRDILEQGRLFTANPLFPIGPSFPGLHTLTAALVQLSGLPLFVASLIVIGASRLLFVSALFLLYERLTGSARIAGLGCLFYMGSSTFIFFETYYSYASLALPLFCLVLFSDQALEDRSRDANWVLALVVLPALLALSVTHHVTAYALAAILCGALVLRVVNLQGGSFGWRHVVCAILALALPLAWSRAMGNPGVGYLGPVFESGIRELVGLLTGSTSRKLFTSDSGDVAPAWQRYLTLASVGLVSLGLALGFFPALLAGGWNKGPAPWRFRYLLGWRRTGVILLTCVTIAFPASVVFRLTRSGWEIGNRIGPFAFFGVGLVLAILVALHLQARSRSIVRATALAGCATIIICGGIISGEGPRILVPRDYQVSADAASIEPMGIAAARWTHDWLGKGNRFATDRINRLLLSGFGEQRVSTTLQHGSDVGVPLVSATFGQDERAVLLRVGIEYLLVDLRLTMGRPVVGSYFDGALADHMLDGPPSAERLLKFNGVEGVSRLYDNGYSIIFDVRQLNDRG